MKVSHTKSQILNIRFQNKNLDTQLQHSKKHII